VIVAWNGRPLKLKLRLPGRLADAAASYKVVLESAESREGQCHGVPGFKAPEQSVEGQRYVTRSLLLLDRVPPGYHRLHLQVGGLALEAHLIAAPSQAYAGVDSQAKSWGLFCPLYVWRPK
jgi:hypothetical protein